MDANRTPPDAILLSLADAAAHLGISPDAARKRLERGTLHGEKRAGRWRVYLESDNPTSGEQDATADADRTPPDAVIDSPSPASQELLETLRSENAFLRTELEARTEEIRRRDHIIAGLVERVQAIPATIDVVDVPQSANYGPLRDDRGEMAAAESMTPASDRLALRWRAWWRRVRGGQSS